MMALLHGEVAAFKQVVAVDGQFDLFTRVWCIAELAQAYMSGVPQHVCLLSNNVLEIENGEFGIYAKLVNLRVTECRATRQEDKTAILAKIPNFPEFDSQLQVAIFGKRGLLSRQFVGFDTLYAAARSASRVRKAFKHRNFALGEEERVLVLGRQMDSGV